MFFPLKQADEQNHALSEKARLHLENYNFPVEMMVALPNGTIVNILLLAPAKILISHLLMVRDCVRLLVQTSAGLILDLYE